MVAHVRVWSLSAGVWAGGSCQRAVQAQLGLTGDVCDAIWPGSICHSRRNCGNSKRGSFHLAWSVGVTNHQRSLKIVCRNPSNGSEFLKTWLRCQVSSPRKGVWNCTVPTVQ